MMNKMMPLKVLVGCAVLGTGFGLLADEPEPLWGRVFGVYCQHNTKSGVPAFPFYSQKQINPSSTSTSGSAATPDTSSLDPAELASLPTDAFTYTGYVSEESSNYTTFTSPAIFTPGASYRMNIYLNEPYQIATRTQYAEVNGVRLKDESGQDLVIDPSNINFSGTRAAKKVWKFVVSNVVAKADGTISWGFPRKSNKSAMNVITFDGTNPPTTPVLNAAAGATSVKLSWTACADTLAYHVERQDVSGQWVTIAQTHETTYDDVGLASVDQTYRIVASNGVGVAFSNVSSTQSSRSLYALHLAAGGQIYGRFVPAAPFLSGSYKPRTLQVDPVDVPPELLGCGDLSKSFAYLSSPLTFSFSNLTANATYNLRLWTIEPYADIITKADPDTFRRFSVRVNGVVATNDVSAWTLSGHVLNKPVPVDFSGTADEAGTLAVRLQSVSDTGTFIGLELFTPKGESFAAPPLKAYASSPFIRLVADDRSAEMKYDFQYRDLATDEPTTFLQNVPGWSVYDMTLATGQTREYRARVAHPTAPGPWCEWLSATCTGRSPYVPLRVNHTRNATYQQNPPAGWIDGEQFRTSIHVASNLYSTAYATAQIDFSRVSDPAPEDVYRTQFFTADEKDYRFVFPGFDPACDYKVRVHMMETWANAKAGTRTFGLGIGGGRLQGYEKLDAFVAAGSNHNTAVVFELTTRPQLDGSIPLDVFHVSQNATIRGTEIVPLQPEMTFDGQVKSAWYANASATTAIEESCVAETSHDGWSWTADDMPDACAGTRTRLMARGLFAVPVVGTYGFKIKANGLVRLWLDGSTNLLENVSATVSNPISVDNVALSAGTHELVLEYLQGTAASFAVEVAWTSAQGTVGSLSEYTSSVSAAPRLPEGWKSRQMGNRSIPSYVFQTDATEGRYRVAGSGQDVWGGSCDGTFLYKALTGTFELKMRIADRGGIYVPNTRFGVSVRSTLGTSLSSSDFILYAGINGDPEGSAVLKGYEDADGVAGTSISGWGSNSFAARKPNLPLWVKCTRDYCPTGGHRYVCAFSNDNENWYFARTQDVARVQTVYVGPWVMGHHTVNGTLAWMEVDGLEVTDTTPRGTMIYFR